MFSNQTSEQRVGAGTMAGAGTFRCEACGFSVACQERDEIPPCPHCGQERFVRQSIFASLHPDAPVAAEEVEPPSWLAEARDALVAEGQYLAFEDDGRVRVVQLQEGITRLGRGLGEHVRFDDPTVSRRHALVKREEGRAKLLDDRSLNGVFVNGRRCEACDLQHGDEILIGRFRLYFISTPGRPARGAERAGRALG